MSKLERLIQQYCPDGVEWKALYSITKQFSGMTGVSNKWAEEGNCVFIDYNNVYNHTSVDTTALNKATVKSLKQNTLKKGDILFTSASETPDECALSSVIEKELPDGVFLDDHLFGLRLLDEYSSVISPSYLKYAFRSEQFRFQIRKVVRGATRHYVSKVDFMKLEIPVPPLPVQEEIVRILDAFTELQAELQKRKQQYNYYLDNLLNFKNINRGGQIEVRWMKLKDLATQWYRGAGIKREEVSENGMPCIRYGEIHTTYNIWFNDCISRTDESRQKSKKHADKGDILFAITSEDIPFIGNSVAYLGNERILVGGDIVVMKHNQDPKYMAYALSTSDAIKQKGKGKVKSKVVHTNVPSLQEIVIPIPSITEQKRIAAILDRFDTLTNDLTAGLPAEIEKRRQQYEYYRDKLLTFKRKGA